MAVMVTNPLADNDRSLSSESNVAWFSRELEVSIITADGSLPEDDMATRMGVLTGPFLIEQ
jgi:hypothetical protein